MHDSDACSVPGALHVLPVTVMRKPCSPRPRTQGPESSIHGQRCVPAVGAGRDRTLPPQQPLPPTRCGQRAAGRGQAGQLGSANRAGSRQVPKAGVVGASMGTAGNQCQGQVPGGSGRAGTGAAQRHGHRLDGEQRESKGDGEPLAGSLRLPSVQGPVTPFAGERLTLECHRGSTRPQQCWAPTCSRPDPRQLWR